MNQEQLQEIFKAKEDRRRKLASLPIDEKVHLIEKLRDFAHYMRRIVTQSPQK